MKRLNVSITVLILWSAVLLVPVFGQEVTVTYVDGDLTALESGSWSDVFSGDVLSEDSTVKAGQNTIAELDAAGRKIIISKPGTYPLAQLVSVSRRAASFGKSINVMKYITGPNHGTAQTAVMGVRGAKAEGGTGVEWLTEDSMALSDAQELIESGKYKKAISVLKENLGDAFDEELPAYDFYLGKSYYLLGEQGKALSYLSKVAGDPAAGYYSSFVVLKGNLLLNSFAFDDALTLFDRYLKQDSTSETAQLVAFLSAKAYSARGDKNQAKKMLKIAVSLNGSNKTGKTAQAILDSF